jgi:hypothetical protein
MSAEKVREAILKGNIVIDERVAESLSRMALHNPDFTLVKVEIDCCWGPFNDKKTGEPVNKGGFSFNWDSKSAGCGRVTFYITNEGELRCENQGMDKDFIKDVFAKFLEQVKLDDK